MSVKDLGNTFNLIPKWARTLLKEGKVLAHLVFELKVLPGSLAALSA
jgi:hypothetical protein